MGALIDALPDRLHNALNIAVDIVELVMMLILANASVAVLARIFESGETSPAMLLPMWIMYLIVLIGFIGGALRSIEMVVIHIRRFNERPITEIEQEQQRDAVEEWVVPATIAPPEEGGER